MSDTNNADRAYALADAWIEIVLSTNPELLVEKLSPTVEVGDGKPAEFNFQGAVNRARALAEFRQQLGNALSSQHFYLLVDD